jgi:hypothetical protein
VYRSFICILGLGWAWATTADAALSAAEPLSLSAVYGHAVRDTNGDGLADDILARIILPGRPSLAEVEAATNLSARLGYETTAASLPTTLIDDRAVLAEIGLPVLIGRENRFVRALVTAGGLDLSGLSPGQGLIAWAELEDRPVLVVAGADDAGTLAASMQVSARLPRLWTMSGVTLEGVESQAAAYLRSQGVTSDHVAVVAMVVDADRRGIASLRLRVNASDRASEAVPALERLNREHRFGRETDILDFGAAAITHVEIVSDGRQIGEVALKRTGANWRALSPLPRPQPAMTAEALLAAAAANAPQPAAQRGHACVGCPAFLVDGMIPGGGGGVYSSAAPREAAPSKIFDLSEVYSLSGWYGDRYQDLLPDSTETAILVGGDAREALGAADISARLGLETTGVTFPIARSDASVLHPRNEPSPILIGRDNRLVQALAAQGKVRLDDLKAGEGVIQLARRAFGTATATVVAGADVAGADAAAAHLARRLPFVWDTRPGDPTLEDMKTEALGFFAARSTAGQAVQAVEALSGMLAGIEGRPLDRFDVKLFLAETSPTLDAYLRRRITSETGFPRPEVKSEAVLAPMEILREQQQTASEIDDFRSRLHADVLPQIAPGQPVEVRAWLSEDPATRAALADQVRDELRQRGAGPAIVEIHSAYKQGLFWLIEQVLPQLSSRPVASVHIKIRSVVPDYEDPQQVYQHPARWLKSLYPADEIFVRDLGMPSSGFVMEMVEAQSEVYVLEARDAAGVLLYSSGFTPHLRERKRSEGPAPSYRVQIETGRIQARVAGRVVADSLIETDIERVRNAYVQTLLPEVTARVEALAAARTSPSAAPLFRDLTLDLSASEPDYDLGVGGQHLSSVEALGGELTSATYEAFGKAGLRSAGRIIPIVRARSDRPSQLEAVLTRNAASGGRIEISYQTRGTTEPVVVARDLTPLGVDQVQITRIRAYAEGLRDVELRVSADPETVTRALRAVQTLADLKRQGVLRHALSYEHVEALTFAADGTDVPVRLIGAGVGAASAAYVATTRPYHPLVAWDHEIGPEESERIIRQLAYYPSVAAYRRARSWEGRDVSVLEITAPGAGDLTSMAKLSAYKPTALVVGRQHGNEPSSTSYILSLAERLASDPAFSDIVARVNVVFLPIMNPDGAALAGRIRQARPHDVASPGYLSAIGQDVTVSTALPESMVDPWLWRRWLPDLYLNAHGATSHEVPAPLNNFVTPQAPTYAFRRGWYSLGFRVPRDPRYPDWEQAALGLRDAMAREISKDGGRRTGNLRDYDRFARWGHGFAPHLEPLELHDDVMLFYSDQSSGEGLGLRRLTPGGDAPDDIRHARIGDWPLITLDGGTFEAPDEGARGEQFELAVSNGFAAVLAHLKYLRDGRYALERIEEEAPGDGARLTTVRVRPVMPPLAAAVSNEN